MTKAAGSTTRKDRRWFVDRIIALILSCIALFFSTGLASGANIKQTDPEVLSKASRITIPFVENKGQFEDPNTLFYSNTFAGQVAVARDGSIGYRLMGKKSGKGKQLYKIRERLSGGLKPSPSGGRPAVAKVSYFRGKDPKKWFRNLSTYHTIDMGEIYPGVQLTLQAYGNNVEKIFHVHPGTDAQKIQLTLDGAETLKLTAKGELAVDTGSGSMRFTRPVAYQWVDERKIMVDAAYTFNGNSYGFKVAAYDRTKELIIDPLITTVFQGTTKTWTRPNCMAADSRGNIYVAGNSADQLAVFKFDSRLKTLLGSAFLGTAHLSSKGGPTIRDIAIDSQDVLYFVGSTEDKHFPVTEGAFDTVLDRAETTILSDGFVTKYNADLNTILASTLIGEDGFDVAYGIAIAKDNTVYVVGETENPRVDETHPNDTPFPTTPAAYDTNPGKYRKTKAFIIHLNDELTTMLASTLLGYNGDMNANDQYLKDRAYAVAIDAGGDIVVAGVTESGHFPVSANCADTSFQGKSEAFVSKFDPELQQLLASTFLGGANEEQANVLRIDANNEIIVAGWTLSSDFPVVQGCYDTAYNAYEDGFVSRLNNALTAIQGSTFIGGNGTEQVSDMVIGDDGSVLLCGGTGSSDFPVTENCHDSSFSGGMTNDFYKGDGFIAILDQTLKKLSLSTYLGGDSSDHIASILVNNDDILVAGETESDNFPYMIETKAHSDAFVCRFNANETPDPLPYGRPGHWQSEKTSLLPSIYLDVNICDNGSFSGIWSMYVCMPGWPCSIADDTPQYPVSGTIDFVNGAGTINLNENCRDVPFGIAKQSPDRLAIVVNPDGAEQDCATESVVTNFYYKGEYETGTCQGSSGGGGDGSDGDDGGGGGGCFITNLGPAQNLTPGIWGYSE